MTNLGKWSGWAEWEPVRLGNEETYRKAAEWLDGYGDVIDIGGGTGYAARFFQKSAYRVVDGSLSKFNSEPIDAADYRGESDCVLVRHLLEHCFNWLVILTNAVRSFRKRAAIVTFMPLEKDGPTRLVREESVFWGSVDKGPVPVLCLSEPEFLAIVGPYLVRREAVGTEEVFYLEKPIEADSDHADCFAPDTRPDVLVG